MYSKYFSFKVWGLQLQNLKQQSQKTTKIVLLWLLKRKAITDKLLMKIVNCNFCVFILLHSGNSDITEPATTEPKYDLLWHLLSLLSSFVLVVLQL